MADAYNNRLQRFVGSRATDIAGWGMLGIAFGFRVATGVGIDGIGRVYGADFGHGVVRVFDGKGTPLGTFGKPGRGPGELDRPEDVAVREERIYVVDFGNDRVQSQGSLPASHTQELHRDGRRYLATSSRSSVPPAPASKSASLRG